LEERLMEAEPLVCSRCHAEVIGGWADHATLGHGEPWDDCAVCSTTYEEAARSDG
jgi:hypothetical protein